LAIDRETKIAFLAGYDRRAVMKGGSPRGAIWTLDMNAPDAAAVDATTSALPDGFWPHGISLYRAYDGKKTLFVINHANNKHSVEIFDVNGATLTHRRTVTGAPLISPNDIVGVGPESFFVSNDHANTEGLMRTIEDYGRLRQTTVQFYDGAEFTTALSGIGGANGINVSADGRSLYLSAASELTVYVYDRDPNTNALTQRAKVWVPGFADNIDVLADGSLLLGVHSKIFDLLAHVGDASKPSPTHVMHLTPDGHGSFTTKTIYYTPGQELSGGSGGAAANKRLLIGSIFDPKILDCAWDAAP
jgi:arylesterase/paraoxonase